MGDVMKNKIISSVLVLTILLGTVVSGYALSVPDLVVTLMSQDPDPAEPGAYVDLRFKIQNNGEVSAENVVVELMPEYPFSLDPNENAVRELGTIPITGNTKEVIIVKYKVRVDNEAIEGTNKIWLKYRIGDGKWITQEFEVDIETLDATLSVESVETIPEKIRPGESAKVKITIKNIADSVIKDVSFKLDLTFSTLLSQFSTTTADPMVAYTSLPFAPLNSATEKKVRFIDPGKEHTFTYDLIVYMDAESRVYKVPIQIQYFDELDNQYTRNDIIGLVVGTQPDLSVVIDSSDLYLGKQSGDIAIKVINKGFSDVKFLDMVLESTDEYEILSSPEVYMGNVDSDDYETAEFTIYCKYGEDDKTVTERTVTLPLTLTYRDSNGELYTDKIELPLVLHSASKLGMGNGNSSMLVIIVVVAVIAFLVYRRFRKRKKK